MDFDFTSLGKSPPRRGEIDPIKLFRSLQIQDGNINDLWLGQGDALREWHDHRNDDDIAIVLDTGAGKTLIGLLSAQSLVNETQGHVVYVCASIQLVRQTAQKAESYGLRVTTYTRGDFNNSVYQEGLGPCVTTYQALFNGLARRWDNVNAIVFDDAHAASNIIRSQFTVQIDRKDYPTVHTAVAAGFSEHLRNTDSDLTFRQAMDSGDPSRRWFVPPFVIRRHIGELNRVLLDARLQNDDSLKFPWAYVADRVQLCAVFISGYRLWFTPPVVPVRTLPYFRPGIRRLYLSATLAAEDAFLRTFGKVPDHVISPETPAGKCERMVLIPGVLSKDDDDVATAKAIIAPSKALILVPTYRQGEVWDDVVTGGLGDNAADQVEVFRDAAPPAKLRLVARYDGVDLPGDTCRMMVIHGLPSGLGPLERFMWEKLRVFNVMRSTVASRIVQSFGRISRGMSDHGVVILTGSQLIDWLLTPANRQTLPSFLRRQIEVGLGLSKQARTDQFESLASQCIGQDSGWRNYYGREMSGAEQVPDATTDEGLIAAARVEAEFGLKLWDRDYKGAAGAIHRGRDVLFSVSKGLGGWYLLWQGYMHEILDDIDGATGLYHEARRADRALPAVSRTKPTEATEKHPDREQIREIAAYLHGPSGVLVRFDRETTALGGGSPSQVEEAVRCLGAYLGLVSSRPDNDVGTGPDVLWYMPGKLAWSMELKTDKKVDGIYYKRDVMEAKDHVQWVLDNVEVDRVIPAIVGPLLPPDDKANPPDDLLVVEISKLRALRDKVRAAIETVIARATPLTLQSDVLQAFGDQRLLWSRLSASMPGVALKTIEKLSPED